MRKKSTAKFVVVTLLIVIFAYLTLLGAKIGDYRIIPAKENIKLGLDLSGGVYVQLQAKDKKATKDQLEQTVKVIQNRIDKLGVSEPVVTTEGKNRIRVELPDIQDPQSALQLIGSTAKLEFKDESGNVVLGGSDIKEAKWEATQDQATGVRKNVVAFKLSKEGAKKFATATKENLGKTISIELDGSVISAPKVNAVISDGEGVIEGSFTQESAQTLAAQIMGGALPLEMETLQVQTVGPQLGANSFETSLKAGMIGVSLVFLFMLIVYRGMGFIADIALLLFVSLDLFALAGLGSTLTLPGIAGFLLTIGMAVDANVIIFERIKEEARNGKTIRVAVEAGFRRAFVTILDSNVTTLIASVILFYFGSGTVKGFAITLGIGIVASMFTAVFVTRHLMKWLVDANLVKNKKIFGI